MNIKGVIIFFIIILFSIIIDSATNVNKYKSTTNIISVIIIN